VAPAEVAIALPVGEYEAAASARASEILSAAAETAKEQAASCETVHVKDGAGHPRGGEGEGLRSDRHGLARSPRLAKLLLGSQAVEVLTHSTVPVLICR
jgi:CxxC motif-containing protein (DUF1111 family)